MIYKKSYSLIAVIFIVKGLFFTSCNELNSRQKQTKDTPNIVFVLIDDLGWSDTGFHGNPVYETPNLDQLANEGLVFSNAYAPAANCAPSRACIMTGKNTPVHGIYTVGTSERGHSRDRKLIPIENTLTLNDDFITLAEALKNHGYTTASMGKWHLSETPLTQGFDINIAGTTAGHPKSYFSPYKNKTLKDGEKGEYLTDRITEEAIKFIEEQQHQPFFLYLPYYTVHTPLQGKANLIDKYRRKIGNDQRFHPKYGAMVESMDENVGKLLNKIDDLGLKENTIVIFMSDNGGLASVSNQFPIRSGKGSYYEGGIRVPFIVKWPGHIESRIDDTAITGLDIFPTLMDILDDTENYTFDGNSLKDLMIEKIALKERSLFWHFPIYLESANYKREYARDSLFRTRPGSVIRKGDWKLHEYFEDGALELYNLKSDIGEINNLADTNSEKAEELLTELNEWRKLNNAPVPTTLNSEYIEPTQK